MLVVAIAKEAQDLVLVVVFTAQEQKKHVSLEGFTNSGNIAEGA